MTILALGDSFTFGAELSDIPTHVGFYGNDYYDSNLCQLIQITPSKFSWPNLLGQKLGIPVENLSLIGGSNDRIYRLAVDRCSLQKYSLVICAWTSLGRLDLQYQGQDIAVSSQCHFNFDWIKTYTADHYDLNMDTKKCLINLLTLQSYFAQKQQPYLFIKSSPLYIPEELQYLKNQLALNNCVSWESDMYNLTSDLPRGKDHHMLEEGHERIADLLAKHILQNKVLD